MTYCKRSVHHHHLGFEKREKKEQGETDVIGLKFVMNGLNVRFIHSFDAVL